MAFQPFPAFQFSFQQLGAGVPASVDRGVVLFPVEPLRFRKRWDKTAYAWAIFVRDMRAPQGGYVHNRDYVVSVEQATRA
jgi:hypothetical protein